MSSTTAAVYNPYDQQQQHFYNQQLHYQQQSALAQQQHFAEQFVLQQRQQQQRIMAAQQQRQQAVAAQQQRVHQHMHPQHMLQQQQQPQQRKAAQQQIPGAPKLKPYVCLTCTRPFARLEHLKRHERSHTKEKPFCCEQAGDIPGCGRRFARRDLLLRHQQKIHLFPNTNKRRRLSQQQQQQQAQQSPAKQEPQTPTRPLHNRSISDSSSSSAASTADSVEARTPVDSVFFNMPTADEVASFGTINPLSLVAAQQQQAESKEDVMLESEYDWATARLLPQDLLADVEALDPESFWAAGMAFDGSDSAPASTIDSPASPFSAASNYADSFTGPVTPTAPHHGRVASEVSTMSLEDAIFPSSDFYFAAATASDKLASAADAMPQVMQQNPFATAHFLGGAGGNDSQLWAPTDFSGYF